MARATGKTTWFFPDGDIPQPGNQEPHGHESLVILNPNTQDACLTLTVYFTVSTLLNQ